MYVDVFVKESGFERPHVHVSRSPTHKGPASLKIWLDTITLADSSNLKDVSASLLNNILRFVKTNAEDLHDFYCQKHAEAMSAAAHSRHQSRAVRSKKRKK